MRHGPDAVIRCPHCGALARKRVLLSGNTFHSTVWTDGSVDAPMFPLQSVVAHCAGLTLAGLQQLWHP